MKVLKSIIIFFQIIVLICISCITLSYYFMPDFFVNKVSNNLFSTENVIRTTENNIYTTKLKFLNVFEVKDISLVNCSKSVITCGTPMGIDIYTKGLTVAGTNDINETIKSPAKKAGIKTGDRIISVNNEKIETINQLRNIISEDEMIIRIERDNKTFDTLLKPEYSSISNRYEIGLWVRDSSIGMGMVSFYCKDINLSACLGHAVVDVDTNDVLDFTNGSIYTSEIYSINKAQNGVVGQLFGKININEKIGDIIMNSDCGLYCQMSEIPSGDEFLIADKNEVQKGSAQLLTTLTENKLEKFDIEIVSVNNNSKDRNIKIKINDERLINKTGGIVQGMSGSPIIQNGKIVGVLNYALVDDPHLGYAIFAETMYNQVISLYYEKFK
ncbi:MAG: SpoIVB peptidase S55 domain-containing protein [Acutalibacteraceae bacterium]|nr:SpoIVB peptidase S55 domain-containing protein [Acutalibacteraceae bacterium]